MDTKLCPRCSTPKPITEFGVKKNGNLRSWCNPCRGYSLDLSRTPAQKARRKAWYEANKERVAIQSKERWATNKVQYRPSRQLWAAKNRTLVLDSQHERYRDFREWVDSMKAGKPCLDCLGQFPPYVMEYDHVRGMKRSGIAQMASHKRERVLEEIAKCELVCCACHRIRSHNRRAHPKTRAYLAFRAWLDSLKFNPCTDCGKTLHPVAMDFDHVRGGKILSISNTHRRDIILVELTKCELVCANCHRERTVSAMRREPSAVMPMVVNMVRGDSTEPSEDTTGRDRFCGHRLLTPPGNVGSDAE